MFFVTLFIIGKTETIGQYLKYRMDKNTVVYPFNGVQAKQWEDKPAIIFKQMNQKNMLSEKSKAE